MTEFWKKIPNGHLQIKGKKLPKNLDSIFLYRYLDFSLSLGTIKHGRRIRKRKHINMHKHTQSSKDVIQTQDQLKYEWRTQPFTIE